VPGDFERVNFLTNKTIFDRVTTKNHYLEVAVQFKARICGLSLARIVSSDPARDIDVRLLSLLCVIR